METMDYKRDWHLIRNDNGEWISDDNVIFVSKVILRIWQSKAARMGKTLSVQYGPDGSLWCYKHELETIK
jgi:hypothetical protein